MNRMKKFNNIIFFFYLLWFAFIVFLNLKGNIGFGHGLGDWYYIFLIFFLTILTLYFYFKIIKNTQPNKKMIYLFIIFIVIIIISFSLKLTLFRGPEFPWNGDVFLQLNII